MIISNPVAGGGVQVGDEIEFYPIPGPAFGIRAGAVRGEVGGIWLSPDGNNAGASAIEWDGFANFWSFNGAMRLTNALYSGYTGSLNSTNVVFPGGAMLGNGEGGPFGGERVLDTFHDVHGADWHLRGDTSIHVIANPGQPLLSTNTASFEATLNAPLVKGVTTSVAVTACPQSACASGGDAGSLLLLRR